MGRVLIAEDETIIRLDLRAQLENAGHVVAGEARDGAEAVELARTLQPDVVLLDVKMPKLDGIEAAKRIREESPVPIVMVTAYGEQELVRRAADAGAYGYLLKPFGASDVGAAVEMATARHKELEDLREEVGTLQDALAARKAIERAKGLLMEREGLSEADAFARMRTASQRSGQPLKLIAEAIVVALG
jgi:response regulator NasT